MVEEFYVSTIIVRQLLQEVTYTDGLNGHATVSGLLKQFDDVQLPARISAIKFDLYLEQLLDL